MVMNGKEMTMPSGICTGCGCTTNSAVSNWWEEKPEGIGVPTKCYAAFVDEAWVRGCDYDNGDEFVKSFVDNLLKGDV